MYPENNNNNGYLEELFAKQARDKFLKEMFSRSLDVSLGEAKESTERIGDLEGQVEIYRKRILLLEIMVRELLKTVEHDGLTGLLNRIGFMQLVELVLKNGIGGTLLVLDIDKFKSINDTYGHETGDKVLIAASDYLRQNCRLTDFAEGSGRQRSEAENWNLPENVGRWGGEEFVVFFPNNSPEEVFEKFKPEGLDRAVMRVPFDFKDAENRPDNWISFSGGLVELKPGQSLPKAFKLADQAMYSAKNDGRDRLEIYSNSKARN